jgi:anti-anti-sigma factor
MKMLTRELNGIVILTVDSTVLQEHVPLLRERLLDFIANDHYKFVIDMIEASYMSSMALAMLLEIKRLSVANGGDIRIANANKLIRNLFMITNLQKALEICDSVDDAVARFGV